MPPVLLAAAFAADLVFGDPRRLPHPVVAIGRLAGGLERLLYDRLRPRRLAGAVLVLAVLAVTAAVALALLVGAFRLGSLAGYLAAGWLTYTCLATRELHRQSAAVIDRLAAADLDGARRALGMIVGRDTAALDEQGILRACLETVAENSSDGIVAPLFYLALGGPFLGLLYKAASTLDSLIGYRNARYREFGWAAARLDDLLNWLPARLTALLMALAALFLGLDARGAWRIARRDARKHASPNAGYPEAAAAGALGVQLGGPACYFGAWQEKPTFGDPGRALTVRDYRRLVELMYATATFALLLALAGGSLLERMAGP